ncbi:hypothetical protein [Carp edema virus]|nr:hypothetical protein [Carp edema virus]
MEIIKDDNIVTILYSKLLGYSEYDEKVILNVEGISEIDSKSSKVILRLKSYLGTEDDHVYPRSEKETIIYMTQKYLDYIIFSNSIYREEWKDVNEDFVKRSLDRILDILEIKKMISEAFDILPISIKSVEY